MIAYAGPAADFVQTFVDKLLVVILYPLITLLLVIAVVYFLYGCFQFVAGAGNPQSREQGRKHILWGLIGLLVMLSAYTILTIAAATFGIEVQEPSSPFAPSSAPAPAARPSAVTVPAAVPPGGP